MLVPIITDIHIGARSDSPYFQENFYTFIDEQFFPYLIENNLKEILILGDIFERRKFINFHTLYNARIRFFDKLRDMGIEVVMICGNHDVYFKNTNEVNSLHLLLDGYENIHIIIDRAIVNYDGLDIGLIAWINSGNYKESIEWLNELNTPVLAGHFEIKNFEMVKGHFASTGFDMSVFEKFNLVLSGHFHIRSSQSNITYIGNPNQTNWGDYGYTRGFAVLDTKTIKLDYIDNKFNAYVVLKFSDIDINTFDFEAHSNKIIKIYVEKLDALNRKRLDLFIDKLGKIAFSVEVNEVTDEIVRLEDEHHVDIETDTIGLIKNYITATTDVEISKDLLMDYFVDIYQESVHNFSNQ
ncbi:MAG: metallophosphoesterase [Bacteroidales bacterium]